MLALASTDASGAPGTAFTSRERRERLLALLSHGCKKDAALRPTCIPLAAHFVAALPSPLVRAALEDTSSGGLGGALKGLVGTMLPKRHTPVHDEREPIELALCHMSIAQPDAAYLRALLLESDKTHAPHQRALLLRVLGRVAQANPNALAPHAAALRSVLRPLLRTEAAAHAALSSHLSEASHGGTPPPFEVKALPHDPRRC
jgi:hypothetical protein